MNNLETNALRIAELMGYKYDYIDKYGERRYSNGSPSESEGYLTMWFSSYNGLMPIVFECAFSGLMDFEIFSFDRKIFVEIETIDGGNPINTEPEFIKAIQLAVIKYLELKNEN